MLYEVVGWLGAFCILLAYWLLTVGRLKPASFNYQLLNLVGSVGVLVNAYVHFALPLVTINVVWIFIAMFGLLHIAQGKKRKR